MSGTFSALWALRFPITSLLNGQLGILTSRSKSFTGWNFALKSKLAAAPTLGNFFFDLALLGRKTQLIFAPKLASLRMKADYISWSIFSCFVIWWCVWRSYLHGYLSLAAYLCVSNLSVRCKPILGRSAISSLKSKSSSSLTPVHESLRFGFISLCISVSNLPYAALTSL